MVETSEIEWIIRIGGDKNAGNHTVTVILHQKGRFGKRVFTFFCVSVNFFAKNKKTAPPAVSLSYLCRSDWNGMLIVIIASVPRFVKQIFLFFSENTKLF